MVKYFVHINKTTKILLSILIAILLIVDLYLLITPVTYKNCLQREYQSATQCAASDRQNSGFAPICITQNYNKCTKYRPFWEKREPSTIVEPF